MQLTDEGDAFFGAVLDVSLIVTAIISSLLSLTIPYLYYIKKECREHPTVLLANISVLEAVANFNIILMAYNMYGFQNFLNIKTIFHTLIFNLDILPDEEAFCQSNYYIYMFFELLSISFHICYSIDLFITLKYPFYSGKKRRKIYYLFSILLPIFTIANSISYAEEICDTLQKQSIYYIPLWFLVTLLAFVAISIIIIFLSFFTSKSQSEIRKSYIRQHRATLFLLVLLWVCPIWSNFKIHFLGKELDQFAVINVLAFFSIISSSGIITVARLVFDSFIRKRVYAMFRCKLKAKRSQNSLMTSQHYIQLPQQQVVNDEVWNLPLSGAMNEFQSQQVVHNIIQVVCQACSSTHRQQGRQSVYRDSVNNQNLVYESIVRNTVHIEHESETTDENFLDLLLKERREQLLQFKDPNDCDLSDLRQFCKRKRRFNMVCTTHSKICNNQSMRLRHKTVKIKSQIKPAEYDEFDEVSTLDIKVTSYSHRVFECLRNNNGLVSEQIEKSLDLQKNITQIKKAKESLGASGSFFFFSFDHKLVIKTISEEQKDKMIQILPEYFEHYKYNEQSLIAKIYGIFSIQIEEISKIYFLMMQNTLKNFLDNNLEYRLYDLKGSTIQREVKTTDAPVYKDINYFRSSDCFIYMTKQNKVRFIDIIQKDLEMLKKFNIMDYSLLLAVGKSRSKRKSKMSVMSEGDLRMISNYKYIQELESVSKKIYCISIIDFLQEFNMHKKMELWLKKIFKGGGDISSVDTQIYFDRFIKFIKRITVTLNFPKNLKPIKVSSMRQSSMPSATDREKRT